MVGSQLERCGFELARQRRRRLAGRQPQGGCENRQHGIARVHEVVDIRVELILFNLCAQHILHGDFSHGVLRAGNLLQVPQQIQSLAVDPQGFIQEVKVVIGFLKIERGLQHAVFKDVILSLAFRGGDRAGGF